MPRPFRHLIAVVASALVLVATIASSEEDDELEAAGARCATRLSIALVGRGPDAALASSSDPQAAIPALLADPDFHHRFARFANGTLNEEPGMTPAEDATYWLARKVLEEERPWRDMFTGRFRVDEAVDADGKETAEVVDDPDGLGYFRSPAWMRRYAGNEEAGYRLVAAYRILHNTIGVELTGVDSSPDVDPTAAGRMAPECRGCHYDGPFALDLVAKVLSRRVGEDEEMTFVPPDEGAQTLLDGDAYASDAELVDALVDSVDFRFRACRLAFQFLYGRGENQCEAELFDHCMAAFEAEGTMQAAVRTIAADPGFCE